MTVVLLDNSNIFPVTGKPGRVTPAVPIAHSESSAIGTPGMTQKGK